MGLNPSHDKIGEVVLSALPATLRIEDTQAYIRMECERGNPVSALGGGNGLWKKKCSPHCEVAFRPCVSGDLHKKNNKKNIKKTLGPLSKAFRHCFVKSLEAAFC